MQSSIQNNVAGVGERRNQSSLETERAAGGLDLDTIWTSLAITFHRLRLSRQTRDVIPLIFFGGILLLAYGLWRGGIHNVLLPFRTGASPDVGAGEQELKSRPEVRFATAGAWIDASGLWAKYGVLGAAFDGEKIVMNSAESARGNIGCWISPHGQPMTGVCHEMDRASNSHLLKDRSCTWKIVVLEISPSTILGTRLINTKDSDPACTTNDEPRPYVFVFEKPHRSPRH